MNVANPCPPPIGAIRVLAVCAVLLAACGVAGALVDLFAERRTWVGLVLGTAIGATVVGGALMLVRSMALRRLARVLDELQQANVRFDLAINNMSQGLCFFDGSKRLIVCNDRYADIYRLRREWLAPGTTLDEIVGRRYAVGCSPRMECQAYLDWRCGVSALNDASETVSELVDGRIIAIHHRPMPGGGWVATHEDITERHRAKAEAERMARHDALTGLTNRIVFRQRLEQHLAGESAAESADAPPVAVLCIDLDRFKAVNDTLGHPVGDELLRAATGRMSACAGPTDVVARLGGDEFAIIQSGLPQPAAAMALGERLVGSLSAPFAVAGQSVCIGASVGVVLADRHGDNVDALLARADLALYAAKSGGGGQARLFEWELDRRARDRRCLERDLRQAVAKGELQVVYQPIVELGSGRITAFEASLRWHHPVRGLLLPDCFVPLAEETGLIDGLGEWMIFGALAQAARWPAHVGVVVKLSPAQLKSGGAVATVAAALAATGLAAARVEVEVTEAVLLVDEAVNLLHLNRLGALGVPVGLDDFGVGYSSLAGLRSFPFAHLKIDRSFVRDMVGSPQVATIVAAMATVAGGLGMALVAEGVETAEQRAALQALGCDKAQGQLLGRPVPAAEAMLLLQSQVAVAAPICVATAH